MVRKNKHRFHRTNGIESTKDDDETSTDPLVKSHVREASPPEQGTTHTPSWNENNNGKHKQSRQLSGDNEGSAEAKTKGVMKAKNFKGRSSEKVLSPASRKASVQDLISSMEEATIVSPTRVRSSSSDVDEFVKLPAEYPPPAEMGRRRSSAHRVSYRKAIQKSGYNMNELDVITAGNASPAAQRKGAQCLSDVDWSESAMCNHHIWSPSNASGDLCYVGEQKCLKAGPRKKCNACHIVVHDGCYPILLKIGFQCKVTFRESTSRSMRENLIVHHHWVHRRKMEGKCRHCGKSFEKRFGFREPTKIIAISCSWCKEAYHNKVSCFQMHKISEPCSMGSMAKTIVPPTWIIKSSQRQKSLKGRSKKKKLNSGTWRRRSTKEGQKPKTFIIRPLSQQACFVCPTLVFINPKSGGKQGSKLLQQFQWYLNPRQICDLSKGGPQESLEFYRKVPNLRILACGGDGTVGWILSVLDKLNLPNAPPVGILPLGTGNDLSRTLNFGAGYSESDSITKIIQGVEEAKMVKLDRWKLVVTKAKKPPKIPGEDENSSNNQSSQGVDDLPLDIFNNYFSIGSDAQVSLSFHNRREARPEKFTSRLGNKMFYAKAGMLEYVMRETKNLYRNTSLLCDGMDYTWKIREIKPVCILFLNIPRYSAGCVPWGNPTGNEFKAQVHDDRMIEVLAFGIHQLGMALVGGHGERICQCKEAFVKINKPYPVQVDGEPCLLNPSTIKVEFYNQANVLYKGKRRGSVLADHQLACDPVKIRVNVIQAQEFLDYNNKKDPLCTLSTPLLVTVVMNQSTLDTVRSCLLLMMNDEERPPDPVSEKWIFLDASSSDKFYKIDKLRENLLTVSDIINSDREVYILDNPAANTPHGNLQERPRSHLATKQSAFRNRVQSDSGVMLSPLESFGSVTRSEDMSEETQLNARYPEDDLDRAPVSLDIVFEEPEISGPESNDVSGTSSRANGDVTVHVNKPFVAEATTTTTKPSVVQNDPPQEGDSSSQTVSNYVFSRYDDQRSSLSLLRRPPLLKTSVSSPAVPPQQLLSVATESPVSFEPSNGKKNKKKTHKRSSSDTDPKKTAGFTFSPGHLLGLTASNKNNSNNSNEKCSKNGVKTFSSGDGKNGIPLNQIRNKLVAKKSNSSQDKNKKMSINRLHKSLDEGKVSECLPEESKVNPCDKTFLDASKRGNLAKVTSSVTQGADLCVYDDEGYTALHHAVCFAHGDIVDYLLRQENPNLLELTCKARKQTALHKAAWFAHSEICEKLVEAGASLDVLDHQGMTAADNAKEAEDPRLVEFLSTPKDKTPCQTDL